MHHHGAPHREWELFDCGIYPQELVNVYSDTEYQDTAVLITGEFTIGMNETGDTPKH